MGVSSSSRFPIIRRASTSLAISLLAVSASAQQRPKVPAPHDPIAPKVNTPTPQTPVPGSMAGGPWIVDSNFKSILYLKNVVETSSITITPIVYLSDGTKYQLSPMQLEPSGIANVDIGASLEALGIASNATLSGWMELQYNWPWEPVCAMIRAVDVTHSVIFGFGFAAPGPLSSQAEMATASQVRDGMWWKQEKNVTGFVTLANTTSRAINAVVEVTDNHAVMGSHTITVSPQGMATLDLQELQTTASTEGGIRVSYVGAPDGLLVNGGLEDIGVGYSANVPFTAPERPSPPMAHAVTPQSFAELGLMTGAADPYMHFPDGTIFTPYSVLRNVSTSTISATPTLWWMQGSTPASFQLQSISLLPNQTYSLDMPSLLATAGLKDFSGSVNLVFDTQGASGLLMAAGSVDQTNTYVFEVAPRGTLMSAGKSLSYWSTGNGDDTMVTIWNPADEAQTFIFRLMFAGGHYDHVMTLGPRATAMFDISEIIAGAGADAEGNIIPAGTQEGSAKIVGLEADNQHILVSFDAGVYNVRKATCVQSCVTCNGTTIWSVSVDPFSLAVNAQKKEHLYAQWNTGMQYEYTSNSTWSSTNTSIATVQTGMVQGLSAGSLTVSGGTNSEPVYVTMCGSTVPSCPIYGGGGSSSPGTVAPTITSISPSAGLVGTGISVTITGTGFASGATVNAGSNISVSNVSVVSSTEITATFTPSNSTSAGGNQGVTVTSVKTSNSKNFFVQYPVHLVYTDESMTPNNGHSATVSGTDINIVTFNGNTVATGVCGGYQWLTYITTDQGGNQIKNGTITFTEAFSNFSPSPDPFAQATPNSGTVNLPGGYLGDTQGLWNTSPPACLSASKSDSFNQGFTAAVGSVKYSLTTVVTIARSTNSQGVPSFNVSITTP